MKTKNRTTNDIQVWYTASFMTLTPGRYTLHFFLHWSLHITAYFHTPQLKTESI